MYTDCFTACLFPVQPDYCSVAGVEVLDTGNPTSSVHGFPVSYLVIQPMTQPQYCTQTNSLITAVVYSLIMLCYILSFHMVKSSTLARE